jgi:hypothetical protein
MYGAKCRTDLQVIQPARQPYAVLARSRQAGEYLGCVVAQHRAVPNGRESSSRLPHRLIQIYATLLYQYSQSCDGWRTFASVSMSHHPPRPY